MSEVLIPLRPLSPVPPSTPMLAAAELLSLALALAADGKLGSAAALFASEACRLTGAERVALGFARSGLCRVVGLSHAALRDADTALNLQLGAAMDEALSQRATLCLPPLAASQPRILQAQRTLAGSRDSALCTVPLACGGEAVGAAVFEFCDAAALDAARVARCEQLLQLAGPLLHLLWLNERPWWLRLQDSMRRHWKRLRLPENHRLRRRAMLGGLVLGSLLLLPVGYEVGGQARVEGAVQRTLSTPVDGFVERVHVRPGDTVRKGQLLAELSDQELQLEQSKWLAELEGATHAFNADMARQDRAKMALGLSQAEQASAELARIRSQLARMQLRAPFDGVLIEGDLSQALGAPVKRGDALMKIAPAGRYRVIINVDERDIRDIRVGSHVRLALGALPWNALQLTVRRIAPVASAVEGGNVFEVEAGIDSHEDSSELRPGLRGVASIEAGHAPLAWSWSRRALGWLRLQAWAWWGA
ncbi:MAG: efflux RND transporter periplasmic adaptor subunit [Rubrivivax sp.]